MAKRRGNTEAFSLFSFQDIITSVTGIMILVTLLFSLELTRQPKQRSQATESQAAEPVPSVSDLKSQLKSLQTVYNENDSLLRRVASLPAIEIETLEKTLSEKLATLEALSEELTSANDRLDADTSAEAQVKQELEAETLKSLDEELRRLQEEIASTSKSAVVVYNPDPGATKTAWLIDLSKEHIRVFPVEGGAGESFDVSDPNVIPSDFIAWVRQRDNSQEYFVLLLRPESIVIYDKLHPMLDGLSFDLGFDLIDDTTNAQATISGK